MLNTARRIRGFLRALAGKDIFVKLDITYEKERFGSDYGGWDIITANIDCDSIVYSFGVGEDASFDTALIEKFDLTIHAFDPTPKSIKWVKRQGFPDQFVMHEYGIASFDGTVSFNPPENPDHVSHTLTDRPSTKAQAISVPVKRLGSIMVELGHDHINVLKMDIEGAGYGVINDICASDIRPEQLLVEFHHDFPSIGINKTKQAIEQIRSMGYLLFSASDINKELCFVRNLS